MRSIYRPGAIVETWFEFLPEGQRRLCRALMAAVQAAGPDLLPVVKSGHLIFLQSGVHAVAIAPYSRLVHLQVFNGSAIATRFPMLRGCGPGLRQMHWRGGDEVDATLVQAIVRAALAALARRGER